MSHDDYLRRSVQDHLTNNPHTPKFTPEQMPDYHNRQVVNNEMDRIRKEDDERQRRERGF